MPTAEELLAEIPLSADLKKVKRARDEAIKSAVDGKNGLFLLIIGPCSADREDAVCEYIGRLAGVQEKVRDKIIIIPRIYTNKPRTTGKGYKGMAHQVDPMGLPNIEEGLKAMRRMHVRALRETHLTVADEMLYPGNYPYLEDILSYVAVGARSVENQAHRLTVSGLDIPVGMKNPTSGDLEVMLNSVAAAQMSHHFVYNGWTVHTSGNLHTHCILRGAVNHQGQNVPNYHYEDLVRLAGAYKKRGLANMAVIVDVNHSNSDKDFREQPRIAGEILRSRIHSPALAKIVKGLMIESYLVEGSQETSGKVFGKSITDSCLGWEDSERLIMEIADGV